MIASFMEVINMFRAGGFDVLFAGKATYQSAISELTGTLPSTEVILIATAFLGLGLSTENSKMRATTQLFIVGSWLVLALPMVTTLVLLGRRGPLLSLLIVFPVSYFFFLPIKTIKFRWFTIILAIYLIVGFLYGIRPKLDML